MRTMVFAIAAIALTAGSASSLADDTPEESAAILADLSENNLSAEEIQGVTSLPAVRVAGLESFSGADLQSLEETLQETEDGFGEVRAAIEANETLESALRERDVPISRVVAVTRAGNGAITVYTGKPAP